jgi:hypothetical protein
VQYSWGVLQPLIVGSVHEAMQAVALACAEIKLFG